MKLNFQPPEEDDPRDDDQRHREMLMPAQAYDALQTAHDHLDMSALRVSHAKDAAKIESALDCVAPPPSYGELLAMGADCADTLLSIGRRIGFGRAQQILGEQWDAEYGCAPRGVMGVTVKDASTAKDAYGVQIVYRWQAVDFSGFCYGSYPPANLPEHCDPIAFCRQPSAFQEALTEIAGAINRTATHQQFARHLQKIAQDAIRSEAEPQ